MMYPSNQASAVLARLSKHLDKLSGQVFDMEEQLGSVLDAAHIKETVTLTKIQSLDFVRQSLEDCALLLHYLSHMELSDASDAEAFVQITKKLKLNTTQEIAAPNSVTKIAEGNFSAGDMDLL